MGGQRHSIRKLVIALSLLAVVFVVEGCNPFGPGPELIDFDGEGLPPPVARLQLAARPTDLSTWTTNLEPSIMASPKALPGGILRWPLSEFPATLRPVGPNSGTAFISMVTGLVWETLLGIDDITMGYTPGLASHWRIEDDGRSFLFHIDPDARWSDGVEVTAEDVLETWRFLTDPIIKDPFANEHYGKFEEPEILSKYVVRIRSKKREWRAFLSVGAGMQIFPAHALKGRHEHFLKTYQFAMMPGTGPYRPHRATAGKSITFRRRKEWWAGRRPQNVGTYNFDQLVFQVIHDEALTFEKFKAGELDWLVINVARRWLRESDFDKVEKGWIQKREIWTQKPAGVAGFAFNMRRPPFDDIRVRKALAYAYNREQLNEKLFYRQYYLTDSHYPNSPYENPKNTRVRFDARRAADFLAEAGYRDRNADGWLVNGRGEKLELDIPVSSNAAERIYTVFQEDLKKIGVKLNLQRMSRAAAWKKMHEHDFQLCPVAWTGLLFPNPESSFHSKYADEMHTNNVFGLKDPEADRLIEDYNTCFDLKRRVALLKALDGRLFEHQLYAFGWYLPYDRLLFWNRFGQPEHYYGRFSDYRDIIALWWIDPQREKALAEAREKDLSLPKGPLEVTFWRDFRPNGVASWNDRTRRAP